MSNKPTRDIHIVVAMDEASAIGIGSKIPWKIKTDLKRFREITLGHTVLMGRKTCESIVSYLGGPLKSRRNLVLSRNDNFSSPGFEKLNTWFSFLENFMSGEYGDVYIVGGAEVYRIALPFAQYMHITRVCVIINEVDAHFPSFEKTEWKLTNHSPIVPASEADEYSFYYETFKRIENQQTKNELRGFVQSEEH